MQVRECQTPLADMREEEEALLPKFQSECAGRLLNLDSVLRTETGDLEPLKEDAPRRIMWYKPMSCLGVIRPHRRDESW